MLTTPILSNISALSPNEEHIFTFNVIGGSQVVANRMVIKKNSDNSTVYNEIQTTFNFRHTLPNETLTPNTQYNAQVFTRDINGNESQGSNIILFWCFTIPNISITNITGGIINNSTYVFEGEYSQVEGEELESYIYYLYDQNSEVISTGELKYDDSLTQVFSGLIESTEYGLELKGITEHGMEVSTGIIPFTVHYITSKLPTALTLKNLDSEGKIRISGKFISIEGKYNGESETYVDNEFIDLTNEDSVYFDEGINISNDFTLRKYFKNPSNGKIILSLIYNNDVNKKIELIYFNNRIDVYQKFNNLTYYTFSNTISAPTVNNLLLVWVQRKNGLIDIKLTNLG